MTLRRLTLSVATLLIFIVMQPVIGSAAAQASPAAATSKLLEFHVRDMHGSTQWGGVELYSDGEMVVCDDHGGDNTYITGEVYDYDNNHYIDLVDFNGAKSPCYYASLAFLNTYDEIEVSIFESPSPHGPQTEKAHSGGLFLRS